MKAAWKRNVSLFIAMSLDGYIADSAGRVDWLKGHDSSSGDDGAYCEFIQGIDTVLMGWNTYHQIVTELSPGKWVYGDLDTYVITHRKHASSGKIQFTDKNPAGLIDELKKRNGKGIWICGGASIVRQLVDADVIDCYCITIIPVLLGAGIRLFEGGAREIPLELLNVRAYNGMTELRYERRQTP